MKNCYINACNCITSIEIDDLLNNPDIEVIANENIINVIQPSYKELIPPAMSRRMAKGVKMGIFSSNQALKEDDLESPDAIMTGTGMGCIEDSEKFLKAIIENNEEFLTPTSFIQSTHNTVGAQIALGIGCKNYNFTYVNGAISFEAALQDALLQINNEEINNALVGGIEETSSHTVELYRLIEYIKQTSEKNSELLNSKTPGSFMGEGSSFFVLSNQLKPSSYAQLVDVAFCNETINTVEDFITNFLKENQISIDQIDLVSLGYNGDINHDSIYNNLSKTIFKNIPQYYFKHITGEFYTSNAISLYLASHAIKNQKINPVFLIDKNKKPNSVKYVLLYNQYLGKEHSLILLKHV